MLKANGSLGFCLDTLCEQGYAKSSTLLEGVDTAVYARRIISQINSKTYCEKVPAHSEFINMIGMNELAQRLFSVAQNKFGYRGDIASQYHIARHVVPAHRTEKFRTHFDSHLFTVVIPMQMPDNEDVETDLGQLYFAPKTRSLPKNEFQNICQKLIAKRFAGRGGYERGVKKQLFIEEDFRDGCPIIFLGKQSLHGNRNVGINANRGRLTLLAHYFDDTGSYGAGGLMRNLRRR